MCRLILADIERKYRETKTIRKQLLPRLDIIKANNRVDTNVYIRKKLEAMQQVSPFDVFK